MRVEFTIKASIEAYRLLSHAQQAVERQINELISRSNAALPDVEIIFCPLCFPTAELKNFSNKIRSNKRERWISVEKWIPFEPFLPPGEKAKSTYIEWVKSAMLDISRTYPELEPAKSLIDRLVE